MIWLTRECCPSKIRKIPTRISLVKFALPCLRQGRAQYLDFTVYDGEMSHGLPHGHGKMTLFDAAAGLSVLRQCEAGAGSSISAEDKRATSSATTRASGSMANITGRACTGRHLSFRMYSPLCLCRATDAPTALRFSRTVDNVRYEGEWVNGRHQTSGSEASSAGNSLQDWCLWLIQGTFDMIQTISLTSQCTLL